MPLPVRVIETLGGIDPRSRHPERIWDLGVMKWGYLGNIGASPFSMNPSQAQYAGEPIRPFVTDSPGFTTDNDGRSFPPGTVWVAKDIQIGPEWFTQRPPGDTAASITNSFTVFSSGSDTALIWYGANIPAGAAGTITVKTVISGTLVGTITVSGSDGTFQVKTLDISAQTDNLNVTSDFSAGSGVPRFELVAPPALALVNFYAVPSSLPGDFTPRTALDNNRRNAKGGYGQCDDRRPRRGPTAPVAAFGIDTYEPYVIDGAHEYHLLWLSDGLHGYEWGPSCIGRTCPSAGVILPGIPFFNRPAGEINGTTVTTYGARGGHFRASGASGATSGSFVFEVWWGGSIIWTRNATVAEVQAGIDEDIPVDFSTPHGVRTDLSVSINWPGGIWDKGTVGATASISPRCDIPFHFSALGQSSLGIPLCAPGGYLASMVVSPGGSVYAEASPGATTFSTGGGPFAFIPAADGWYSVSIPGSSVVSVGDDEFGYQDQRHIARGYLGRRFYVTPGGPGTATLTPFSPSFVPVSAGGTTLNVVQGNWWLFGVVSPGVAGTVQISVKVGRGTTIQRGLKVDWSVSDPTCIHPDGSILFEGIYTLPAAVVGASATPTHGNYIVLPGATGEWADHINEVAFWDTNAGVFRYYPAERGCYALTSSDTAFWFFDGTTWRQQTDAVLIFTVPVQASDSVYLALGAFTSERDSGLASPVATVSWAML